MRPESLSPSASHRLATPHPLRERGANSKARKLTNELNRLLNRHGICHGDVHTLERLASGVDPSTNRPIHAGDALNARANRAALQRIVGMLGELLGGAQPSKVPTPQRAPTAWTRSEIEGLQQLAEAGDIDLDALADVTGHSPAECQAKLCELGILPS